MEVEVRYFAMIREATGKRSEVIELPVKSSVGDLMNLLSERYGGKFVRYTYDAEKRVREYLSFMLNGVNVNSLRGFDTTLKNRDTLAILPPVGGG